MRRRAPRALSFALDRVTADLAPATALGRVQGCWAAVVGETWARFSEPVSEHERVVTVACTDAMWANELQMLEHDLLEKLGAALGEGVVAGLRFKAGDFRALL
jgi:predicted nucleic acid-binding Zn ribbon protein